MVSVRSSHWKRERRMTPLKRSQSAWVPKPGASPSLTVGVAGSSTGVFSGGE